VEATPIVGDEDGVAGIGGIVFDAGVLAGDEAGDDDAILEAGDVLRSFVSDAGDGVGVADEFSAGDYGISASAGHPEQSAAGRGSGGQFDELGNLAFADAADLIDAQTAAAFDIIFRGGASKYTVDKVAADYGRGGADESPVAHIGIQITQRAAPA